MSEPISNIKSHIEHIKGEFHWLNQGSPEMKNAVAQGEKVLDELENHILPQMTKIKELEA
jgi:hypothetical protein